MLKNKEDLLLYFLGFLKLVLHFFTNTNYGLHRDEFLYFEQGKHLAWGFYEVPPITPFIGKLADLLGGSVFAIRLFPAIAGAIIIILAGKLVQKLGGGIWAVGITCTSLLLSPSLLGSNSLFQPVSFNQLCWFLLAFTIVKVIIDNRKNVYYILGIIIGIGFLTKYSIVFYLIGLLAGVLLTKERKLLWNKHFLIAIVISFLIVFPNILWQYNHNFPLVSHMQELTETQLVHINFGDFLLAILIEHKGFTFIWILGLIGLFTIKKLSSFKSLGIAFIATIILIGTLQGKPYYTLGAFLILFPFGGIAVEYFAQKNIYRVSALVLMFIMTLVFYPLSIPVFKIDKLKKYTHYLSSNFGINYMLRWEDDQYYNLPQDIADMHGWEEMAQKVAKIYHALPTEQKEKCMVMGGSYGHAGSLNYYREQFDLPEVYSFNGTFLYWAKVEVDFDNQILVDDRKNESSDWFNDMVLVDSIQDPNAREKGYIYYRSNQKIDVSKVWKETILEMRGE